MPEERERELRFERRMSDAEALMWNVEKDPWLNPNGASIALLDQEIELDAFRHRIRYALSKIPRLRERVAPELGRLSPPTWTVDSEFDLDYHVRHIALPRPGSIRQLFDICTRFYEDPYDRTRPLWMFVLVSGVEGGRCALFSKMHHTLSDGISALRLSELYIDRERNAVPPPDVDLEHVFADALLAEKQEEADSGQPTTFPGTAAAAAGHVLRRQAGMAQRTVETMTNWSTDPRKAFDAGQKAVDSVRNAVDSVRGGGGESPGGSPLWSTRSRRRHLEFLQVPLDALKAAGQPHDASINDMFVAGLLLGSLRYHEKRNAPLEALNMSFVVSTRTDKAIGGNSFSPTRVQMPATPMTLAERIADVRNRMAERREGTARGGGVASLAGVVNLLPTSLVTRVARSQVTKMDFATSNMRGAKIPLYVCGGRVLFNVPMGPVAGTAFNATTISYNGNLDIGVLVDPAAVTDPDDLRSCIEGAYAELTRAAGTRRPAAAARSTRATTTRSTAKRSTSTRATTPRPRTRAGARAS